MNNKSTDQTARMHRLYCAFVVWKLYSDFILHIDFTAEYRLIPNPKKAYIFPILEIFSQTEDLL